jgi:hypothetical protein
MNWIKRKTCKNRKTYKKIQTSKNMKNRKTRKNMKNRKTYKKNHYGGTVLGLGKDGCIIDSISCGELSQDNNFVAKFLYNDKKMNTELNEALQRLDPNNERYNYYYTPDYDTCHKTEHFDEDFSICSKNGNISTSNIVFQRKLEPIDTKKMSKKQYRYLRESLQRLHANNISHGDLPDNVMLDPNSNMPIIIDWENGKTTADELDKQMDYRAFLDNFKSSKD